ncbi:MAG: hypothetical protein FJ137_03805 [Deltaproteobacteria bacterium]|nr:hypothetical protein [Deltaproteobacteria bacterium]
MAWARSSPCSTSGRTRPFFAAVFAPVSAALAVVAAPAGAVEPLDDIAVTAGAVTALSGAQQAFATGDLSLLGSARPLSEDAVRQGANDGRPAVALVDDDDRACLAAPVDALLARHEVRAPASTHLCAGRRSGQCGHGRQQARGGLKLVARRD